MTSSENFVIEDLGVSEGVSEGEVEPLDLVNVDGLITTSQRYIDQVNTEKAEKLRADASKLLDNLKAAEAELPAWSQRIVDYAEKYIASGASGIWQVHVGRSSAHRLTQKQLELHHARQAYEAYVRRPVEPAVKLPLSELADVIDEAANILETEGWIQGTFSKKDVGRCAVGALNLAVELHLARYAVVAFGGDPSHRRSWANARTEAQAKIQDVMGLDEMLPAWNDKKGRTAADVIALLRDAARFIRKEIA